MQVSSSTESPAQSLSCVIQVLSITGAACITVCRFMAGLWDTNLLGENALRFDLILFVKQHAPVSTAPKIR